MRRLGRRASLLAAGLLIGGRSPAAAQAGPEPQTYMRKIGFDAAEIASMESGKPVTRIVSEKDDNDASVIGVVRIQAPAEALVDGLRRIETFRTGEPTLQIGRFSATPSLEDLASLVIDDSELDDLRKCRVGHCDVKVGAAAMELAQQVDWKAPDAHAQAAQLIKQSMVRLATSYLERGSKAMAVYNDNDVPESVATEWEKILEDSPSLMQYNPEFWKYLLDFPDASLPGAESFLYWSKDKVRKPVLSVVQVCIQKVDRDGGPGYFIAMKHIYDSHYYLANAEFLTLVPNGDAKSGFFLIHSLRARIDPPHKFRGVLLGKIKGAMRDELGQLLRTTKSRLEAGRAKETP